MSWNFSHINSDRITSDIYNDPAGVSDPLTNTPERHNDAFAIRRQVITDFYCRRFKVSMIDTRNVTLISANGDVELDVYLAWQLYKESGSTTYLMMVWDIYGMVDLVTGSSNMPYRDLTSLELPSATGALTKPSDLVAPRLVTPAQYFTELIEEAIHTQHARRDQPYKPDSKLIENEDMMAILNARGTVLLNMCFHGVPQQRTIVRLSALALLMWPTTRRLTALPSGAQNDMTLPTRATEDEQKADRYTQLMIRLVRDDIQKLMLDAISNFSLQHKAEQERHILTFNTRVQTWKSISIKRTMAEMDQVQDDFKEWMEGERWRWEAILQRLGGSFSGLMDTLSATTNSSFHHGSEYLGPPLDDEKADQTSTDDLWIPWMERRETGFWVHTPI